MVLIYWYITDFFSFIFEAVKTIVSWLVSLFDMIGKAISFLFQVVDALPTVLVISFVGLIAVSVVYKFLGREGQD